LHEITRQKQEKLEEQRIQQEYEQQKKLQEEQLRLKEQRESQEKREQEQQQKRSDRLSIVERRLFRRWTARTDHPLQKVELNPSAGLVFAHRH